MIKCPALYTDTARGHKYGYFIGGGYVVERRTRMTQPSNERNMHILRNVWKHVVGLTGSGDWVRFSYLFLTGANWSMLTVMVRYMTEREMVGINRPSLMRRGSIEKVDMVRNQGITVDTESSKSVNVKRATGIAASKIDFS